MSQKTLSAKDRIIFALDFPSLGEARPLVERLKDHVGMFKIGLALFIREGIEGLRRIYDLSGRPLFLDLKYHDIPETVAQATGALISAGGAIRFITVHASGGEAVLKAAVDHAKGGIQVLGVTVLTSMSAQELKDVGIDQTIQERVLTLARVTKKAGGAGVVCSSLEARAVKKELGTDFILVTPGIRPAWAVVSGDDQRRTMTPKEAIVNGADYLVVGRPIAKAKDPVSVALKISQEIEEATLSL